MNSRRTYELGFTIIEIIVVLVLLSIIAAAVMGRGINTERIDLMSQLDKVRNHYRYAHSMAMKHGDAILGFRCDYNNPREYWLFRLETPIANPIIESSLPANRISLPGEPDLKVNLTSNRVTMDTFIIFFDRFGRPYTSYTDETTNEPLLSELVIDISTTSDSPIVESFSIIPETGIIR
jgi:prepilin-type N-terminal cleavage/methylation domain-containing protein